MPNTQLQEKIDQFWKWFAANHTHFLVDKVAEDLIQELDNQILDFGLFSWQIGEGTSSSRFLTISPNGNPQRLLLSKEIIDSAPNLPEWEFYASKPAKDWDFTFEMYDSFMVPRQIDASEWAFALFAAPNDKIEIRLWVDHPFLIDYHDKKLAADLVVTNTLGEETLIKFMDSLTLVKGFIPEHQSRVRKLTTLRERFAAMLK